MFLDEKSLLETMHSWKEDKMGKYEISNVLRMF